MSQGITYSKDTGITDVPPPTKERKQRSINAEDILFTRYVSPWSIPNNITSEQWRLWVQYQPISMICRETMTANMLALDWQIVPRESKYRDELAPTIKYYTKLLNKGGYYYGFDYSALVEWLMTDLQDLPFGAGAEIGRKNDSPSGRVIWIKPLDGGTLYPTLNRDFPVVQYYQSYNVIKFPAHAIARTYMSPQTSILKEGWGMAPPEKIFLALEMLNRGDKYYANLLLEVPPAGILDLGDMQEDAALSWAKAFRSWSQGNLDAFAIPILYEHTSDAKFLPFGKAPNDLMYDRISLKYAAITCAGYGMGLGDIGLQSVAASGETLAGSIRSERKTKRTGFARSKKKIKYLFDSILPDALEFKFTDLDDELNVSLGRARLASATASQIWMENGVFDAKEMRLQTLEDGIITINVSEEPPKMETQATGKNPERPGLMGYPQNASAGGQGEVKLSTISVKKSRYFDKYVGEFVKSVSDMVAPIFRDTVKGLSEDELYLVRSTVDSSLFGEDDSLGLSVVIENAWKNKNWMRLAFGDVNKELKELAEKSLEGEDVEERLHGVDFDKIGDKFIEGISASIKDFIGRSVIFILKDMILVEDALDDRTVVDYDSIVEAATTKLVERFDEFVGAAVDIEAKSVLQKIIREV